MSVLSAQSIRRLCQPASAPGLLRPPLIKPFVERGIFDGRSFGLSACSYDCRIAQDLTLEAGRAALASTIEEFCLPPNVCGSVLDKSSYARIFVSAFNTHLDPGWHGFLTVELANLGELEVIYRAGSPLCQVKFEFLDEPTEIPYRGKYLGQENRPVGVRFEPED